MFKLFKRAPAMPSVDVAEEYRKAEAARRRAEWDNLGGVPADMEILFKRFETPLPPRKHHCAPSLSGFGAGRCACGAISPAGSGYWMEKNSTRDYYEEKAKARY